MVSAFLPLLFVCADQKARWPWPCPKQLTRAMTIAIRVRQQQALTAGVRARWRPFRNMLELFRCLRRVVLVAQVTNTQASNDQSAGGGFSSLTNRLQAWSSANWTSCGSLAGASILSVAGVVACRRPCVIKAGWIRCGFAIGTYLGILQIGFRTPEAEGIAIWSGAVRKQGKRRGHARQGMPESILFHAFSIGNLLISGSGSLRTSPACFFT